VRLVGTQHFIGKTNGNAALWEKTNQGSRTPSRFSTKQFLAFVLDEDCDEKNLFIPFRRDQGDCDEVLKSLEEKEFAKCFRGKLLLFDSPWVRIECRSALTRIENTLKGTIRNLGKMLNEQFYDKASLFFGHNSYNPITVNRYSYNP